MAKPTPETKYIIHKSLPLARIQHHEPGTQTNASALHLFSQGFTFTFNPLNSSQAKSSFLKN
jgi:hypothetical protein